ncbi:hypothetical protein MUP05_02335 [Candidatus Bathyarchaeota archaeon]|nr:hypothetical protein [Candidatus Bathyarchaeota archaeon]
MSLWRGIEFIARGDKETLRSYNDLLNYVFKQIDSLKRLVAYVADEDWDLASKARAWVASTEPKMSYVSLNVGKGP